MCIYSAFTKLHAHTSHREEGRNKNQIDERKREETVLGLACLVNCVWRHGHVLFVGPGPVQRIRRGAGQYCTPHAQHMLTRLNVCCPNVTMHTYNP